MEQIQTERASFRYHKENSAMTLAERTDDSAQMILSDLGLLHMIDHNEHHAEELADLLDTLPTQAKKQLTRAIGTFEAANVELRQVLEYLED